MSKKNNRGHFLTSYRDQGKNTSENNRAPFRGSAERDRWRSGAFSTVQYNTLPSTLRTDQDDQATVQYSTVQYNQYYPNFQGINNLRLVVLKKSVWWRAGGPGSSRVPNLKIMFSLVVSKNMFGRHHVRLQRRQDKRTKSAGSSRVTNLKIMSSLVVLKNMFTPAAKETC